MRALASIDRTEIAQLRGLLFDLDDTLLDHGSLTLRGFHALCSLAERGVELVAVTGRPTSWGEVLARQWPVLAVITENGLISCRRIGRTVVTNDRLCVAERTSAKTRLAGIVERVHSRFPELHPSDDCAGRVADYTFDIGENRRVDSAVVTAVIQLATQLGARCTRSSVHLHLSLDHDDKASGALRFLSRHLGISPTLARQRFAFIGDSENDAACFAAFHTSVGVANLRGNFSITPRFITSGERSAGFAEAAQVLFGA